MEVPYNNLCLVCTKMEDLTFWFLKAVKVILLSIHSPFISRKPKQNRCFYTIHHTINISKIRLTYSMSCQLNLHHFFISRWNILNPSLRLKTVMPPAARKTSRIWEASIFSRYFLPENQLVDPISKVIRVEKTLNEENFSEKAYFKNSEKTLQFMVSKKGCLSINYWMKFNFQR